MIDPTPDDIKREADQDQETSRADAAERVKIQWSIADATMKALLLANGGAMIGLFTFVGNLIARSAARPAYDAAFLRWSFGAFVVGLICALLTHAAAFLSQEGFYRASMFEAWRHQRIGRVGVFEDPGAAELDQFGRGQAFYAAAFGLALISISCFGLGCWYALQGVLIN